MKLHKILPHTADVRLYVESDTLAGLFEAALEGMAEIIKSSKSEVQILGTVKEMKIKSRDITSLLIDFLSEVLTHSQEEKVIFEKADIKKLTNTSIEAKIFGEKVDGFDEDIKAVTYHEADVRKNDKGNFKTTIIFDV